MGKKWTKREEAILMIKYEHASWTELKQAFRGRSKKSIEQKALALKLTRPMFSTKKGLYFRFARCPVHGRVLKDEIIWKGKHLNIATCPRLCYNSKCCGRRLKVKPINSKLRRKYRSV